MSICVCLYVYLCVCAGAGAGAPFLPLVRSPCMYACSFCRVYMFTLEQLCFSNICWWHFFPSGIAHTACCFLRTKFKFPSNNSYERTQTIFLAFSTALPMSHRHYFWRGCNRMQWERERCTIEAHAVVLRGIQHRKCTFFRHYGATSSCWYELWPNSIISAVRLL